MEREVLSVAVAFLLLVAGAAPVAGAGGAQEQCTFPVTYTDATGTDVTVEEEPQRVVTLGPSAAQTMWEIGAEDKVVGVSQYASYLDGAGDKTVVTSKDGVKTEQVVALEPDLVLAPNIVSEDAVRKLRQTGLTVVYFENARTIDDVAQKTTTIGELTGECEGARETVDWMNRNVDAVEQAVADEERPKALYTFFGYTAGDETFIDNMIRAAGAQNAAADADITGYKKISDEVVVEQNPDWLVLNSDSPKPPSSAAYNETTAIQENNTVVVDRNYISQPAPRSVVYTVRNMTKAFHPEAYEELDQYLATETTTRTTETTADTEAEASTTTTPDEETAQRRVDSQGSNPSPSSWRSPPSRWSRRAVADDARRRNGKGP
ncbi:PGF-CTERM-anchored ABC transporter substrate-binding protein [Halobacteriaceae archaeon GCM10025711]